MQKTCSKCTQTFVCYCEMNGCWCESVQPTKATLQYLEESYENCLCPECLSAFAMDEKNTHHKKAI